MGSTIEWNKYQGTDGEWAELGAFIIEASTNGSWVVRHKTGAVPCRASADIGGAQVGGLEAAKAACERVLSEVLAAPRGPNALASTAALIEQRAITMALCRRYQAARVPQREASASGQAHLQTKAASALEELDRRVLAYIEKNT